MNGHEKGITTTVIGTIVQRTPNHGGSNESKIRVSFGGNSPSRSNKTKCQRCKRTNYETKNCNACYKCGRVGHFRRVHQLACYLDRLDVLGTKKWAENFVCVIDVYVVNKFYMFFQLLLTQIYQVGWYDVQFSQQSISFHYGICQTFCHYSSIYKNLRKVFFRVSSC